MKKQLKWMSAFIAACLMLMLFAVPASAVGSMIGNQYLEFFVGKDLSSSANNGRFTIGTTGGNPSVTTDDNKKLLYGHPSPWSTFVTIRINGVNYKFQSNNTTYDTANLRAISTMTADNVLVTQTLQIIDNNDGSGYKGTVKISYTAQNMSASAKDIGIRVMLDTQLGSNDGVPFSVPSLGDITQERELSGSSIPQYWYGYDQLTNTNIFAVGTLYRSGDAVPDKVQFAAWQGIYYAADAWNYSINTSRTITGDSAVGIYWNPKSIAANGTLSVNTYYGLSDPASYSVATPTTATPTTAAPAPIPKNDTPTPPVPVLYDISKTSGGFSFKVIIANADNNMKGSTVTVKLNDHYPTIVTIGNNGIGEGILEAPGFSIGTAVFSARIDGMASPPVTYPWIVSSTGKMIKK